MDIEDDAIQAEHAVMEGLAKMRWVLQKKMLAVDKLIRKNSNYWFVDSDGLVELNTLAVIHNDTGKLM